MIPEVHKPENIRFQSLQNLRFESFSLKQLPHVSAIREHNRIHT